MGAHPAGGAGIHHPGPGIAIRHQPMAMAIDDHPRLRIAAAQALMATRSGHAMAVFHDQKPAGQFNTRPFGDTLEKPVLLWRPFAVDIVVAAHGIDLSQSRLQTGQRRHRTDITAMHGKIGIAHQIKHPRIDLAMGIGKQGDG